MQIHHCIEPAIDLEEQRCFPGGDNFLHDRNIFLSYLRRLELKIGPLLLSVTAPQPGIVENIPVDDGATVGYGTPLVDLHPL